MKKKERETEKRHNCQKKINKCYEKKSKHINQKVVSVFKIHKTHTQKKCDTYIHANTKICTQINKM